jgi:hypothetical protein
VKTDVNNRIKGDKPMTIDALTKYEETSFWARDYGPYSPNPSLAESIKADVVLVGGGILGFNTAREFKKDNPNARDIFYIHGQPCNMQTTENGGLLAAAEHGIEWRKLWRY